MQTCDIHHTIFFPTTALDIYQCIMDERRHSSFTASSATIEDKENTLFTALDGYISGKNIVLERGKKIIQTWRVNEELWPESHFSEVVILLSDIPEEGCRLDFYHTAIPATMVDSIKKVWHEYYWEPLRFYLER